MKKDTYKDKESLKQILCYSSTPSFIAVTDEMVDELFDESIEVILLTATGHSLSEIINSLTIEDALKQDNQKVLIVVRTLEDTSLTAAETVNILNLVSQFSPDAEVSWGMGSSKNQVDEIILFIALSSK